ncbi:MAG: hypothetical protein JO007_22245 [Alphaproteobacteria bacterium]|nr:hypothetical protein [Alphaproteobacteria bacterium]
MTRLRVQAAIDNVLVLGFLLRVKPIGNTNDRPIARRLSRAQQRRMG